MSGDAAGARCAVCGEPGRYVRDPKAGDPAIWCADHVPSDRPPWVLAVRAILMLAILSLGLHLLGRWLPG
jgi:hypothetical protein